MFDLQRFIHNYRNNPWSPISVIDSSCWDAADTTSDQSVKHTIRWAVEWQHDLISFRPLGEQKIDKWKKDQTDHKKNRERGWEYAHVSFKERIIMHLSPPR